MAGITQPSPWERVNANGVWDLPRNKRKMTVLSLCSLLLCADLLDLAVGKCDNPLLFREPECRAIELERRMIENI